MERNPLIVVGTPRDGEADENALLENWQRAQDTGLGCVIIDAEDGNEASAVSAKKAGAYIYVNREEPEHRISNYHTESGAERVAASVNRFDRFYNHDIIINVYAKLPPIAADLIKSLMYPLANLDVDIATLVMPLTKEDANSQDVVKVEVDWFEQNRVHILTNSRVGRANNFARNLSDLSLPVDQLYRHVPIYAYKRASLDRFVRMEPTAREMEERLEPERALANGMRIDAIRVE